MKSKVCTKCEIRKGLAEFHVDRLIPDGHKSWCKVCCRVIGKERREDPDRANKKYLRQQALKRKKEFGVKTCTKCGVEKTLTKFTLNSGHDDGRHSWCKACSCDANQIYQRTNVGKENAHKYHVSEKGKKVQRRYESTEKRKEYLRKYHASEKARESRYRYYKSEKGGVCHRKKLRKRRALKRGATIGPIDEAAIYKLCGNKCTYCGSKKNLSLDHIVALAAGGPHTQSNLTVACRSCNSNKGTKDVHEWLKTRTNHKEKTRAA